LENNTCPLPLPLTTEEIIYPLGWSEDGTYFAHISPAVILFTVNPYCLMIINTENQDQDPDGQNGFLLEAGIYLELQISGEKLGQTEVLAYYRMQGNTFTHCAIENCMISPQGKIVVILRVAFQNERGLLARYLLFIHRSDHSGRLAEVAKRYNHPLLRGPDNKTCY